jgi:deoxyribodipyrimidine photo-lyase
MAAPVLVWFRDDLRLADHPALYAALETGQPVLCLYVFDDVSPYRRPLGAASRWWLHQSLQSLQQALAACGAPLHIVRGSALTLIPDLVKNAGISSIFWNRRYDAPDIDIDKEIKAQLQDAGCRVESFKAHLLHEPWEIKNKEGKPFSVFTPFWRTALIQAEPPQPFPAPDHIPSLSLPSLKHLTTLEALQLEPQKPDWAAPFHEYWQPGEKGAQTRLIDFLENNLEGYSENRNRPDLVSTSGLSPHLRFGEISPRQIWHATAFKQPSKDADKFLAELGWREFSYHLLFHNPDLARSNFQKRFDAFPWRRDDNALKVWKQGQTGYPIVDAGLRELWQTGWMHNRVRMIVASFLIKHLMIDWREGEAWFWDTLVDADPANNPASWQWVAGSGADAAPYFRIFNPLLQAAKFDTNGDYIRKWVPELAALPNKDLYQPWQASPPVLAQAGVILGKTYPLPIVGHDAARARALAAFETLKKREGVALTS